MQWKRSCSHGRSETYLFQTCLPLDQSPDRACVRVSVCNQVIFPLLVLSESRSVNAQGDEPLLPLEQKKKKKKLGQMVEPRINLQVVVSSITNAHQVVQAGCRWRPWGGMWLNGNWILKKKWSLMSGFLCGGKRGSQFPQLKKWAKWIIHLFIICAIVLIGIQFSLVCVCMCVCVCVCVCYCDSVYMRVPSQGTLDPLLNLLCLMGSEIHFSWAPRGLRYTCHIIKCEIQSTVWWKGQDFIPGEIIYFFSPHLSPAGCFHVI